MIESPNKAIQKNFLQDELPKKIFCDTNFFVSCVLREQSKKYSACQQVIKNLIEKKILVCFNRIIYYEAYYAFLKNVLERGQRSRRLHVTQPEALGPYLKIAREDYNRFLLLLKGLWVLQIQVDNIEIFDHIARVQVENKLNTADAFHLGTMLFAGENNLASFDVKDFENIPNINLWCRY